MSTYTIELRNMYLGVFLIHMCLYISLLYFIYINYIKVVE